MTDFDDETPDPYDLRPFVVVHLGATLDGRLWHQGQAANPAHLALYEDALQAFQATAYLTAVPDAFSEDLQDAHAEEEANDFVNQDADQPYLVILDPLGESTPQDWTGVEARSAEPILVLTHATLPKRVLELRDQKVSYIFAGRTSLDLELMAWKLKELFQVHALVVTSGDQTSRHFLDAGLMDELSLLTAPTVSNGKTPPTFAPGGPGAEESVLNLVHAQAFDSGLMWTRYQAVSQDL